MAKNPVGLKHHRKTKLMPRTSRLISTLSLASLWQISCRLFLYGQSPTLTENAVPKCPTEAETLKEMLKLASVPTSNNQQEGIVFTTVTIGEKTRDHVEWVSNWYGQLQNVGVAHPIVFGIDDTGETCEIVRSLGICCRNFVPDDFLVAGELIPMATRDGMRPASVDMKFFYALELLSHGYRISFSDDDVFWFKHPFLDNEFGEDMRGLTDDMSAEDQHDGWSSKKCGLQYGSPCMSTGLWDIYPTKASIEFLQGLLDGLRTTKIWEQELANKFLQKERQKIGQKMLFWLFPKSTHANVGVLDQRIANGQPMNLSAVHLGYVHGKAKLEEYKKRGFWHPKNFSFPIMNSIE